MFYTSKKCRRSIYFWGRVELSETDEMWLSKVLTASGITSKYELTENYPASNLIPIEFRRVRHENARREYTCLQLPKLVNN